MSHFPEVDNMYGLPTIFDADDVFMGRTLDSVSFASNAIHLAFSGDRSVTVQGRVRYSERPDVDFREDVLPVWSSGLPVFLDRQIEGTEARPPAVLILHFVGGGRIFFEDDCPRYESYTINLPAGRIFV